MVNGTGGAIQARMAAAEKWVTLGHVLQPATRTAPGFGASRWAKSGSVAATAVHGIRIKVGTGEFPPMISLVPREFTRIPAFYGGHIPADSGIRTDIEAGQAIFREWAPLVGSPVKIEVGAGTLEMPQDYTPAPGDVLRIEAQWPQSEPRALTFENRKGGSVTETDADGATRTIGTVTQPVRGVGRFDGTSYTGVGSINTNHPGVITIGTAPVVDTEVSEGAPPERRGGFMISPSNHVNDQAKGMPQVMGVGPLDGDPGWEGRYPLFSGAIGLLRDARHPENGVHVQVQIDGGPWEELPVLLGREDDALTAKGLARHLPGRTITQGVTAIRITLPDWDEAAARVRLAAAAKEAKPSGPEPTGVYTLAQGTVPVAVKGSPKLVSFLVDGAVRAASNDPGYRWAWDTTREANGRHWLEVRSEDAFGTAKRQLKRVLVYNRERPHAAN